MDILIKDKNHLHRAAKKFLEETRGKKIFAFYGSLGAGKTTFIKVVCGVLGAKDIVTSPTFTLVNEYKTRDEESLYHIDFYRIKNTTEVFDLGIEEYFSSDSYCFIEWPELIEEYLPSETVRVKIIVESNEQRRLIIE